MHPLPTPVPPKKTKQKKTKTKNPLPSFPRGQARTTNEIQNADVWITSQQCIALWCSFLVKLLSVFDLRDVFDQCLHTIRELRDNPALSGQMYPTWPEVLADVNMEALDEDLQSNPFHEIVASYLARLIEETERGL